MTDPEPAATPERRELDRKERHARAEARIAIAAAAVLHVAGIWGTLAGPLALRLPALLLLFAGAIGVFAGLVGLYTYYENVEPEAYAKNLYAGPPRAATRT